jgi:flagellar hook-basal body complex protein FliE
MVNPISPNRLTPTAPTPATPARPTEAGGGDFAGLLRRQLEQVSQMQAEADEGVQNLLTGRTDNITEVLTTTRKAEIAFSLLMEIRNKLVDAYTELKQLRV